MKYIFVKQGSFKINVFRVVSEHKEYYKAFYVGDTSLFKSRIRYTLFKFNSNPFIIWKNEIPYKYKIIDI